MVGGRGVSGSEHRLVSWCTYVAILLYRRSWRRLSSFSAAVLSLSLSLSFLPSCLNSVALSRRHDTTTTPQLPASSTSFTTTTSLLLLPLRVVVVVVVAQYCYTSTTVYTTPTMDVLEANKRNNFTNIHIYVENKNISHKALARSLSGTQNGAQNVVAAALFSSCPSRVKRRRCSKSFLHYTCHRCFKS